VPRPEKGRIVRVQALDPQGKNLKRRPFVIIEASADPLVGVAISGQFTAGDPLCVELPWQAQGRVVTRLRKRCAAVCNWLQSFGEAEILEYGGVVPPDVFEDIQARLPSDRAN